MDRKILGRRISDGRKKTGLTQAQLADNIGVAAHTVSKWETGASLPDLENVLQLSEALKIHPFAFLENEENDLLRFTFRGRLFHEERMYTRVQAFASEENLTETAQAVTFMRKQHSGQFRKELRYSTAKIAYIIHPLMMACHAHALQIRDDATLAGILLHDVVEDTGITVEELPFSEEVREIVRCLTFVQLPDETKHDAKVRYYREISKNKKASVIKVLDRCNNVSTMAGSFISEKLLSYINETEEFILPLLKHIKYEYPEYSDLAYVVKYHIISVLETIKYLL